MQTLQDRPNGRNSLPLYAELTGSDICKAAGITARSHAPALTLCRQLLAAGLDPDQSLEVYRNGTLALRIRSIGEAAGLEINSKGTGFVRRADVRTAPPIPPIHCPATPAWIDWPAAAEGAGQ